MLTFAEATKQASSFSSSSILLGNGFSVAASEQFRYANLLDNMDFTTIEWIKNLFTTLNTKDFEKILHMLSNAICMGDHALYLDPENRLIPDKDIFCKNFLSMLQRIHPDNMLSDNNNNRITNENFKNNKAFLSHFNTGCIFTLNYDLLLYWSILQNRERNCYFRDSFSISGPFGGEYDEGFNPRNSVYCNVTNLFYLHGALHLRRSSNNSALKKYNSGTPLLSESLNDILCDNMPLIVFEGTSEEKKFKINGNRYLSIAYRILCECSSRNLFIFGFSFSDNDDHILNAIAQSYIPNLYVGLYGDKNSPANQKIKEKCEILRARRRTYNRGITIYYFDSSSVNIW